MRTRTASYSSAQLSEVRESPSAKTWHGQVHTHLERVSATTRLGQMQQRSVAPSSNASLRKNVCCTVVAKWKVAINVALPVAKEKTGCWATGYGLQRWRSCRCIAELGTTSRSDQQQCALQHQTSVSVCCLQLRAARQLGLFGALGLWSKGKEGTATGYAT
jgi:hypothetical protein